MGYDILGTATFAGEEFKANGAFKKGDGCDIGFALRKSVNAMGTVEKCSSQANPGSSLDDLLDQMQNEPDKLMVLNLFCHSMLVYKVDGQHVYIMDPDPN